jgi:hypothetical protein
VVQAIRSDCRRAGYPQLVAGTGVEVPKQSGHDLVVAATAAGPDRDVHDAMRRNLWT